MKNTKKAAATKAAPKIVLRRMPKSDEPCPQQARVLLEVIGAKRGGLTLEELSAAAKGKVKTVQTISAIWFHYRKDLMKRGFVRVAQ